MRAATGEARVGPVEEGKLTSIQRPSGRFTEATWREGNVLNIGPQDRHESIEEAIGAEADGISALNRRENYFSTAASRAAPCGRA